MHATRRKGIGIFTCNSAGLSWYGEGIRLVWSIGGFFVLESV